MGFPWGSDGKESACNVGDLGSIPGLGRSPGEGNGNPLQFSYLENPMDGGAWQATQSMGSRRVGHDWATSLSIVNGMGQSLWKCALLLIKLNVYVLYDPAVPLISIYPREKFLNVFRKDLCHIHSSFIHDSQKSGNNSVRRLFLVRPLPTCLLSSYMNHLAPPTLSLMLSEHNTPSPVHASKMDREAWCAAVHGVAKGWVWLSS